MFNVFKLESLAYLVHNCESMIRSSLTNDVIILSDWRLHTGTILNKRESTFEDNKTYARLYPQQFKYDLLILLTDFLLVSGIPPN